MIPAAHFYEVIGILEETLDAADRAVRTGQLLAEANRKGTVLPADVWTQYSDGLSASAAHIIDARVGVNALKQALSH